MDLELFCATDRVVVTHGHNLLLRRMRLEFVQGEEQVKKKGASLQNCVHRENGVRIAFKTLLGPLVEFPLPPLNHLVPVTISKTKETSERWLPWQRVHEKGNSARSFIICSHSRVVRTVFI